MAETYRFVWGEVKVIIDACTLATQMPADTTYGHIETEDYDLDFDRIGIVIHIPHDRNLNKERR